MELMEAIRNRHSVRSYTDQKIEGETLTALREEINVCNREGGLHIQLVTEEPEAFSGFMAHYGHFENVKNYIALIGKKDKNLSEKLGYYGERIALKAQQLGLNTCWVALTYSKGKSKCVIEKGEKLVCVIAVGYGATQGKQHTNKPAEKLYKADSTLPDWFQNGLEAVMLAPTATNQQKFLLTLNNGKVNIKDTGGFYSKIDLGIVKYHFEVGSGRKL